MELETVVRDVLHEHAADAPAADGLLQAVNARGSRRGRWFVAGLSAAAVAVLAVSLATLRGSAPVLPRPTPPANPPRPTLGTPPGYTRVAYHEFTVAVPDGLPVLTTRASRPPVTFSPKTRAPNTTACQAGPTRCTRRSPSG